MMDQRQNSTVTPERNKRKLEEDIQLAKQRAQEIAARLSIDAESKRPRLFSDDNNGFSNTSPTPLPPTGQTFTSSIPPASLQSGTVYGLQGSSKTIAIPNGKVGMVIGKGGETIRYIQLQSGAKIQITRDSDADPYATTRNVELLGTQQQIERAEELIINIIKESDQGNTAAQTDPKVQPGNEQIELKVPNHKVASLIGKGGETIRNIQSQTGARIQIIPLHLPPGDTSTERNVYISGMKEQVESARSLVNDIISVNRPRHQGGYMQQQPSYPPPQSSWAPPGQQMPPQQQQPGYGFPPPPPPPYYGNYAQSTTASAIPPSTQQPPPPYYGGYPSQEQSGSASSYYGAYPPSQTSDQSATSVAPPPSYYYGQSAEMGTAAQPNLTSYGYGYGYPPPPPVPGQTYEQEPSKQTSQTDDQNKSDSTKPDGTTAVEQPDNQQQVYPYSYGTASYTTPPMYYHATGYNQMGYGQSGYAAPPGTYPPPPPPPHTTEAYGGSEGNGAQANGADTETTKG